MGFVDKVALQKCNDNFLLKLGAAGNVSQSGLEETFSRCLRVVGHEPWLLGPLYT